MSKLMKILIAGILCAALGPTAAHCANTNRNKMLVATFSGIISPVAGEYLGQAITKANSGEYDGLIIRLDTPGGLDLAMRDIIKDIMASKVPVIVYVSPPGARAASAGVFIGMSAHVLAMAPGTNIGAAHPVVLGGLPGIGGDKDSKKTADPMEAKMLNDASAYLKSISQQRKRNVDWAIKAVTKSDSIPAEEAVKLNVADFIAADMNDLLAKLDGREIPEMGKLSTKGDTLVNFNSTPRQKFLATISDPNVAMILMSLGAAGLLIELYNPGLILPGVVGAMSLITGFYAFHTLSANFAGVLLILLGILLFIVEIHITSYGLLAVGGVTSIALGSVMLFKGTPSMGVSVSMSVLASTIAGLLLIVAFTGWLVIRAQLRKVATGEEALAGTKGIAKSDLNPKGTVIVSGELWEAVSADGAVKAGNDVVVVKRDGLKLIVKRSA